MTLLRGKGLGLEVVLASRDFDEALVELGERLAERPDFYLGTTATAAFGSSVPLAEQVEALRCALENGGITLRALSGTPDVGAVAAQAGLEYVPATAEPQELERRRALRPRRDVQLSPSARLLVADFAGARADIAERRKRGEASVRRAEPRQRPAETAQPAAAEPVPATMYHVGTLRGGQSLHQVGTIVVVGDVNPGAELIASGDIVVFGALRGVAHAGAQGDAEARVYALELAATQLRIATCIAAEAGPHGGTRPEFALVRDGRIVIAEFTQIDNVEGIR